MSSAGCAKEEVFPEVRRFNLRSGMTGFALRSLQTGWWRSLASPAPVTRLGIAVLLIVAAILVARPTRGQSYGASIRGVVTDPSGGVIPNAKVVARDLVNGFMYSAPTNNLGFYTLPNLPPSTYELSITAPGFKTFVPPGITLAVAQNATVNAELEVGSTSQTMTVKAQAPLLQAQDAVTGQTVNQQMIEDMPLIGRSLLDLTFLAPGINPMYGNALHPGMGITGYVVNGGRMGEYAVQLDGVEDDIPSAEFEGGGYTPSIDAIQEFKIEQSNYQADKGFSGTMFLNQVTRSGTNQFHGSLYEFDQNPILDANNFFGNAAGIPISHFTWNDFGATFGGPIRKNKLFFFVDWEAFPSGSSGYYNAAVPSAAERQGDFSELCPEGFNAQGMCNNPNNQLWDPYSGVYSSTYGGPVLQAFIPYNNLAQYASPGTNLAGTGLPPLPQGPGNLIDPVALKAIAYYPLPNLNVGTANYNPFNNWAGGGPSSSNYNTLDIKIDSQYSDRTRFTARYSEQFENHWNTTVPLWNNAMNPFDAQGHIDMWAPTVSVNHNFSPNTLLTVSFGYQRLYQLNGGNTAKYPNFDPARDLGMPSYIDSDSGYHLPPGLQVGGGYTTIGYINSSKAFYALDTYNLKANVDKMMGRHEIKFGGEKQFNRQGYEQLAGPDGMYYFGPVTTSQYPTTGLGDAMASFLTGVGTSGWYTLPFATEIENSTYAGYVQDNFRATPKLTVNVGLRYELNLPETERHNDLEWFNPDVVSPIQVPGVPEIMGGMEFAKPGDRSEVNSSYRDFMPRVGLAYRLPHNSVLRIGYGMYYSIPLPNASGMGNWESWEQTTNQIPVDPSNGATPQARLSNPFPTGIIPNPGNSLGLKTNLGILAIGDVHTWSNIPYEQTWSFGLQHQWGSTLFDAEYVGMKGTHQYYPGSWYPQFLGPWVEQASPTELNNLLSYVPNPFSGVINTQGCGICGTSIQEAHLLQPFPQFSPVIEMGDPILNSSYNSFQLRVEKKLSNGLQFLANYTWSKSIDEGSAGDAPWAGGTAGGMQDPNNLHPDRALSANDMPQALNFAYICELPFGRGQHFGTSWSKPLDMVLGGWRTSGMWRFDSGWPIALSLNGGQPFPSYPGQRPNLVGTLEKNGCNNACLLNQYFANPQVVTMPAPFTLGTAPRLDGSVRAPGDKNASLAVFKEIPLGALREGAHLELRLETFNAFNHVQFCAPASAANFPTFGQITCQANPPRTAQLGMKLYF